LQDIAKAAQKSCIMISGQEDVLKVRAMAGVLERLNIQSDDFDVQTFDAQSSDEREWLAAVQTSPFLSEKRVAIVRHLLLRDAPKTAKGFFSSIPQSGLLILVADTVGGTDDRRAKAATQAKLWTKIVSDSQGVILNYESDPRQAKDLIKVEAKSRSIAISDRALDALIEMTGGSFSRALEEFEKLSLYVGDAATITERHVDAIVVPAQEWSVFKLADAIYENHPAEALRQLRSMIGNVSNAENAAFTQILPMTSRLIKLVWQARLALDTKVSLQAPSASYVESLPAKPNILQVTANQQSKLMRMAAKTSIDSLGLALRIVADTDAKLKGFLPSFSAMDSLEVMVLEMTGLGGR
jgi:DNA polymerase-3 subunit delta